jgi:pilus assembly protein CpaC
MFVIFLLMFLWSPARADDVVVGIGSSVQVELQSTQTVHVSNGRIISVNDLGKRMRVTGKKAGITTITTDKKTFFVTVLDVSRWQAYEHLRVVLSDMEGMQLEIEDSQPVVRGRLLRVQDWVRISEAVGKSGAYSFAAQPDPLIQDELTAYFAKLFADSGLPLPDLQLSPASVRLSSERRDLGQRFERLLAPYGFHIDTNQGSLTLEPLVRVQILVTEIRKTMMRRLGISWPASVQAQLLPSFIAPGKSEALNLQLNALEESGVGRILASPNLLCRSGKEAQFLAGGEFPIKISHRKDSSVIWKRYGVLLKIKPVADFSGRMSIALETEVSTIDNSRVVDGVPGLLTNRIESHFDLKGSRTIALSGLIKQETGNSSSGLPGLGSIPILGNLFSSKDFRDEKTELVVFVTPEIITDPGATQ